MAILSKSTSRAFGLAPRALDSHRPRSHRSLGKRLAFHQVWSQSSADSKDATAKQQIHQNRRGTSSYHGDVQQQRRKGQGSDGQGQGQGGSDCIAVERLVVVAASLSGAHRSKLLEKAVFENIIQCTMFIASAFAWQRGCLISSWQDSAGGGLNGRSRRQICPNRAGYRMRSSAWLTSLPAVPPYFLRLTLPLLTLPPHRDRDRPSWP